MSVAYDVAKKFHLKLEELALGWIETDAELSESIEEDFEMLEVLFNRL